jgi:PAS domain S-box-containing protein
VAGESMLDAISGQSVRRRVTPGILASVAIVLLIAAVGAYFAVRFVNTERERDLRAWQVRLGIVADSRAAAIADWLERQREVVRSLAENTALQLYMTEIALAATQQATVTDAEAQAQYLRNLLIVTAERTRFAAPERGPQVAANVRRVAVAGMMLVDAEGRRLVATPDAPPIDARLAGLIGRLGNETALLDIHVGAGGRPSMAFAAPVFAVQADPGGQRVGAIVGVKEVDRELFLLLQRPPMAERTAESMLVRRTDGAIEYVSPLQDGTPALAKRLAVDTPRLEAAHALVVPGGFGIFRDYRDVEVLSTGRAISGVPWTLVHKVDRAEALAESDARLRRMLVILLLGVFGVAAAMGAFWMHGASRRAGEAAERLEQLARRLDNQGRLLRLVTDSQTAAIFIADREGKLRFTNSVVARRLGVSADDLSGKTLAAAFGPGEARRYEKLSRAALEKGAIEPAVERIDHDPDEPRVVRTQHIPVSGDGIGAEGVLVVEDDITEAVVERERREKSQELLIKTLVDIVDGRDPFARHHSQRVAAVARRIAEEMEPDSAVIEAAETAGTLLNIGKIFVPAQLLAKQGGLSEEELAQVRDAIRRGNELIDGIGFDTTVARALREAGEHWDGSGPRGLEGERICLPARIVAVANAFVAMVSHRAYRPGLGIDEAIARLQRDAGATFDRGVVAALVNDLENRGGRARWAALAEPSSGGG